MRSAGLSATRRQFQPSPQSAAVRTAECGGPVGRATTATLRLQWFSDPRHQLMPKQSTGAGEQTLEQWRLVASLLELPAHAVLLPSFSRRGDGACYRAAAAPSRRAE